MSSITYLGHASFEVELNGKTLFFDPWFNQKPRETPRLEPSAIQNVDEIKKADAIFITSEGFDHCDPYDVTRISQRTFCPVIAPEPALANLPDVNARQKITATVGDDFNLHGVDVKVIQAKYYRSQYPVGYLVSYSGKSVYFAGATYSFHEMSQINCDVAVLPIGSDSAMDILSASSAAKMIKTKHVIPMMYNTFPRIKADPTEFSKKASTARQIDCLEIGQTLDF